MRRLASGDEQLPWVIVSMVCCGCMRFGYDAASKDRQGREVSHAGSAGSSGGNSTTSVVAQGASSGALVISSAGQPGVAGATVITGGAGACGDCGGTGSGLAGGATAQGGAVPDNAGGTAFGNGGTAGTTTGVPAGAAAETYSRGGSAGSAGDPSTPVAGTAGASGSPTSAGASGRSSMAGSGTIVVGRCDWSKGPPPFGAATALGLPNTAQPEIDPVLGRDGLTIYFVSYRDGNYGNDVFYSTRISATDAFGPSTNLTQVNSTATDTHLFVSANGLEAFLASDRGGLGGADIFRATRQTTSNTWSTLTPIANVNSTKGDYDPHLESNGLTLWFAPDSRPDGPGLQDIFFAQRADLAGQFGLPIAATNLNTTANEWNESLTDDGLVIVFQSDRGASPHVYFATRADRGATFGAPTIIAGLDPFMASLSDPFVSPDGCAIYFAATLPSGAGSADLYVVQSTP